MLNIFKRRKKKVPILLHIGYPRTSTTWLQESIFPVWPGIQYLGYRYLPSHYYQADLATKIALIDDPVDLQAIRRKFTEISEPGRPNVFSSEGILRAYRPARTLQRLQKIFEDFEVSILIGLRRQDSLCLSRYTHDLSVFNEVFCAKRGQTDKSQLAYPIEETLVDDDTECRWSDCKMSQHIPAELHRSQNPCACLERGFKSIPLWFYDFHEIASLYRAAFGSERVHLILLEETENQAAKTLARIAAAMDVDSVPTQVEKAALIEAANSTKSRSGDRFEAVRSAYYQPGGTAARLISRFAESNRRLQDLYPQIPMRQYGYCE